MAIADEFGSQLYQEMDYRQEAANCHRFRELYGDIDNIFVPGIVDEFTTTRVLTMEWVDGEKGPWSQDGEKLLTVGLQCSVLQLLESGFFHGDPHRGNLLRTVDGQLAYLDFGMMSEVLALPRIHHPDSSRIPNPSPSSNPNPNPNLNCPRSATRTLTLTFAGE